MERPAATRWQPDEKEKLKTLTTLELLAMQSADCD